MFDVLITGATVVDGSGGDPYTASVGVKAGRIAAIGDIDGDATQVIDANGKMLAPGFIDPHTHYDAQLFWDSYATPSSWHGVTTVIGGNCGFSLAPIQQRDADYTRRMMAQVEGMPLVALEEALPWTWTSFGDYLDHLEGSTSVNVGLLVGHCALRTFVLGSDDVHRQATAEEIEAIERLLREALAAGALGLSTSRSSTHVDGEGHPVPSRSATESELLDLCRVVGEYEGTSLEAIVQGCLQRFDDAEIELLARMSSEAKRALNWNVLSVAASDPDRARHQLAPSRRAREMGGRVVALTMPIFSDNNMSFLTFCALWLIPGWHEVLDVPVEQKIERLRDPETRARLTHLANECTSTVKRFANFENYVIGDVYSPQNEQFRGRRVDEIAAEQGVDPFEAIVEIVAADQLRTVLWPQPTDDSEADWKLRQWLWDQDDVVLGGSDAGAHLDRMLGAVYPTRFLADCLRGRQLVSLPRAIAMLSDQPARLYGLRDRGRVEVGFHADLVVFDPDTVGASATQTVYDLPGNSKRMIATPIGIDHVFVNGNEIITAGEPTGATPGTVLRSGRDTATPDLNQQLDRHRNSPRKRDTDGTPIDHFRRRPRRRATRPVAEPPPE